MKSIVQVITILLMAVTAESAMAQDLSASLGAIEHQCNENYIPMRASDRQHDLTCMAAFSFYCMKKFVSSAEYRRDNPGVTDIQLQQGIRDIENNIELACAEFGPNTRNACKYCSAD